MFPYHQYESVKRIASHEMSTSSAPHNGRAGKQNSTNNPESRKTSLASERTGTETAERLNWLTRFHGLSWHFLLLGALHNQTSGRVKVDGGHGEKYVLECTWWKMALHVTNTPPSICHVWSIRHSPSPQSKLDFSAQTEFLATIVSLAFLEKFLTWFFIIFSLSLPNMTGS